MQLVVLRLRHPGVALLSLTKLCRWSYETFISSEGCRTSTACGPFASLPKSSFAKTHVMQLIAQCSVVYVSAQYITTTKNCCVTASASFVLSFRQCVVEASGICILRTTTCNVNARKTCIPLLIVAQTSFGWFYSISKLRWVCHRDLYFVAYKLLY